MKKSNCQIKQRNDEKRQRLSQRIYFFVLINIFVSDQFILKSMPLIDNIYYIDGESLSPADLSLIIDRSYKIDISKESWEKVIRSRQIIADFVADKNRVVYGINTGFGNFADKIISFDDLKQLQVNLIRSHAVNVGEPLPPRTTKRMMILRINTLCKGRSGISPLNLKRYVDALNADYLPMIPEKGTVGASGDLSPLAHLALGMLGQGLAWNQKQAKFTQADQIMKEKNLQPIQLQEKEGLALINGTQFMSSIISEVESLSRILVESAIVVFAFSLQVFGFDRDILSEELICFYEKQQKTVGMVMRKVKNLLGEQASELHQSRLVNAQKNNTCASILKGFQNFAAALQSLDFCNRLITEEMNSATDNPLTFSKEDGFQTDELISAGNFHGEYVAKASDYISMALFSVGRFSQARTQRYLNDRFSNLPGFLVKKGGLNSGFMIIQYTSAALLSQCKVLVKPSSADSISTSASQEDHVSMGGFAARKSFQILENISFIVGIQLMHCLQAVDLVGKKPSQKLEKVYKKARQSGILFIEEDYFFGPQITLSKQLVMKGLNNWAV